MWVKGEKNMKKYQGKKRLYEFLLSHGYDVPKMKEMKYKFYRGSEWLKDWYNGIELYANAPHSIYGTWYEVDDKGKNKEIERTRYLHGECVYKTIRGKCVISSVDKEKRA